MSWCVVVCCGSVEHLLDGTIDTSSHRHDLGSNVAQQKPDVENVTQVMWPSAFVTEMQAGPVHQRCLLVAQHVLGADAGFDFDMLIAKAPGTLTSVPWHADEGSCVWFCHGCHVCPGLRFAAARLRAHMCRVLAKGNARQAGRQRVGGVGRRHS